MQPAPSQGRLARMADMGRNRCNDGHNCSKLARRWPDSLPNWSNSCQIGSNVASSLTGKTACRRHTQARKHLSGPAGNPPATSPRHAGNLLSPGQPLIGTPSQSASRLDPGSLLAGEGRRQDSHQAPRRAEEQVALQVQQEDAVTCGGCPDAPRAVGEQPMTRAPAQRKTS